MIVPFFWPNGATAPHWRVEPWWLPTGTSSTTTASTLSPLTTSCTTPLPYLTTNTGTITLPTTASGTWVYYDDGTASRVVRLMGQQPEFTPAAPAVIRERDEAYAARTAAYNEERARMKAADDRARELFMSHLTEAQRKSIADNRWFLVEGGKSKKRYRVLVGGSAAGNVHELDGDRVIARLCCHADSYLPLADQFLTQKLMLEYDEDHFVRTANRTAVQQQPTAAAVR